jgi:Tfp pilus assembly protein PilF
MLCSRSVGVWTLCWWLLVLPQCSPSTSADYVEQGIRFTEEEQYDRAMDAFKKAIAQNPNNARAYFGLGGIYNMQKDHGKALELFQKAVQADPTYVEGYYGLAYTFETLGKKTEAEENYQKYREMKKKLDGYIEKNQREKKTS